MLRKFSLLKVAVVILILMVVSCNKENHCKNSADIKIDSILLKMADGNYCSLLNQAIDKDKEGIKQFSRLTADEKSGFYHGEVLIQLIDKLGEEFFIEAISDFNYQDKYKLRMYIYIGFFQMDLYRLKREKIENVFPKLAEFLKEK